MSDQYNLLFICTDGQRADTLAAYGNDRIQMPQIDRLASQGMVFRNAYATQPAATSALASLHTGLYPHSSGCAGHCMALRQDTRCLPEWLIDSGYTCGHQGKWLLGDELYAQHGFAEWMATDDTLHEYYTPPHREYADRSPYHHWLVKNGILPVDLNEGLPPDERHPARVNRFFAGQLSRLPEERARPAFLAECACDFIRRNRNRPFVLHVSYHEPHGLFRSCRDGQYLPDDVLMPANFKNLPGAASGLRSRIAAANFRANGFEGQQLATEDQWRRLVARYWGVCGLVDASVGAILAAVEDCRLADRTIVVFTSAQGDMMGSHGLLGGGTLYQEAVRVPLIVRLPGVVRRDVVDAPVSQIDLAPTLLELLGVGPVAGLEGLSLVPVLTGKQVRTGRDVFVEWSSDEGRLAVLPDWLRDVCTLEEANRAASECVRTILTPEGWKFNWSSIGQNELFNLTIDPWENTNLALHAEFRGMVRRLASRIRDWQARTGDRLALPDVGTCGVG